MKLSNFLRAGLVAGLAGIAWGLNSQERPKNTESEPIKEIRFYDYKTNERFDFDRAVKKTPLEIFANYTAGFEGRRKRVYDPNPNDGEPEPTIGIGHFMDRGDSRETFTKALPEINYDAVYAGRASLTNEQVDRLFAVDIAKYAERAKKIIPNFDNFPVDVQKVLVDKAYRGDLGDSPRACGSLRAGKIRESAEEFLNREDYRDAERKGMTGVKKRLDAHNSILLNYAETLGQ